MKYYIYHKTQSYKRPIYTLLKLKTNFIFILLKQLKNKTNNKNIQYHFVLHFPIQFRQYIIVFCAIFFFKIRTYFVSHKRQTLSFIWAFLLNWHNLTFKNDYICNNTGWLEMKTYFVFKNFHWNTYTRYNAAKIYKCLPVSHNEMILKITVLLSGFYYQLLIMLNFLLF